MNAREQIEAALADAAKPRPFELTTLDGLKVFIHQMTPRQVREWWVFEYGQPPQRPLYDQLVVELFIRCCVDEQDQRLFETAADATKLRELPGAGKALEEFYQEARRQNWLFQLTADAVQERQRFFADRAPSGANSKGSSTGSPPPAANPTPTP
jgi:hypothetical protein